MKKKRGFKLKSGNNIVAKGRKPSNFKMMGASPAKQDVTVGELMANVGKSPEPPPEKSQEQIDYEAKHRAEYMAKKEAREKEAFEKEKDLSVKYNKPQIIAYPEGGYSRTTKGKDGKPMPKKYKALQPDGTYKIITNSAGESMMSQDEIQNYTDLFEAR
tara:strand:- start:232 stop:708 length:477 start_codon:yes stop_codon:yes gene_type:complete